MLKHTLAKLVIVGGLVVTLAACASETMVLQEVSLAEAVTEVRLVDKSEEASDARESSAYWEIVCPDLELARVRNTYVGAERIEQYGLIYDTFYPEEVEKYYEYYESDVWKAETKIFWDAYWSIHKDCWICQIKEDVPPEFLTNTK